MAWKKALFLGGAVLLLAACSDSTTAPNALVVRDGGPAAAAKAAVKAPSLPLPDKFERTFDVVCSGYYVRSGEECATDLP